MFTYLSFARHVFFFFSFLFFLFRSIPVTRESTIRIEFALFQMDARESGLLVVKISRRREHIACLTHNVRIAFAGIVKEETARRSLYDFKTRIW
jgi:hypothetical protein